MAFSFPFAVPISSSSFFSYFPYIFLSSPFPFLLPVFHKMASASAVGAKQNGGGCLIESDKGIDGVKQGRRLRGEQE
jgi:hypothetical protein